MGRLETSGYLVHFTKGEGAREDFASIVKRSELKGGEGGVESGFRCVCFSEAPFNSFHDLLLRSSARRVGYKPYGIVVKKTWLFRQGGRPVIYQPDEEFCSLPPSLQWRHASYDPMAAPPVDFSWEREWRIKVDTLRISPICAWLVVPSLLELGLVCGVHPSSGKLPTELAEGLEAATPADTKVSGIAWSAILLSNPSFVWTGTDVVLE